MKGYAEERKTIFLKKKKRACFSFLKLQIHEICYVQKCFCSGNIETSLIWFKEPHLSVVPNGSKFQDKAKVQGRAS